MLVEVTMMTTMDDGMTATVPKTIFDDEDTGGDAC